MTDPENYLSNNEEEQNNDETSNEDETDHIRENVLEDVRRLQEQAEKSRIDGKQLDLEWSSDEEEDEDPLGDEALKDVQNPQEAHDLYYAIRRELMQGLPSREENKELRQFVYDEKNLYLNRGKEKDENGIRGSDGRQAYLSHLTTALHTTREWRQQGGNAMDIYMSFRELNEEAGYRKS
mgnify:CR=1 FL=1